ncbi:PRD domain-containing protein, partial [Lacticaseibacillus paracasei]|uniref:PRD domain-containing protein n=1 Tax=Lacticaseibacillus paracasei TaxID=1597 RepID=UPI0005F23E02
TSQIVTYAEEKLQASLLPSIYYALTDHLHFSVQRYHAQQALGNRIYWEMKTYYPDIFTIGEYGLTVVRDTLDVTV